MGAPRQNPLFAALPVPAFVADESGVIADVSSAWKAGVGSDAGPLVGQSLWSVLGEPLATRLREHWPRVHEDGELVLEGEAGARRLRVEARLATTGEIVGTVLDITARARQADAQRRLAGQLAHGVNNLMTVVIGNIELGQRRVADRALDRALEAALETAELAGQMLAYAGRGAVVHEPTDLHALTSRVLADLRGSVPKHTLLELRGDDGCIANGDPTQLRQLVSNLLVNAGEAIGEERSGEVCVTLSRAELGAEALASSLLEPPAPGPFVVLEIADDGPGMDPATRDRLFDPFFTTKTKRRGLGMAAVLGIVRGHRGAMWIHSQPGSGTSIRVALPVAVAEAPVVAPEPSPSRVVLVAEDEDSIRRITRRALERAGFEVIEARDGEEAIALFNANVDRIRVALLDSLMPGFTGTQVLQQIRAVRPGFPVVVCSGNIDHGALGPEQPSALLPKPFLPTDLIRVVESTLEPEG